MTTQQLLSHLKQEVEKMRPQELRMIGTDFKTLIQRDERNRVIDQVLSLLERKEKEV